jgi:DNA-binding transcriptional LysR family regulator
MDLNLLPYLQILLTTKNVSRAADKLDMSQSSMSRIFSRLKKEFNDPLMVRVGGEFELTVRGEQLRSQATRLMPELKNLWQPQVFDPATSEANIVIAGTDMDVVFVREGIRRIQNQASKINVHIKTSSPSVLQQVTNGEIDIALTAFDEDRSGLYRKLILSERFVAVVSKQNPICEQSLTLDAYLKHRHGMFSFDQHRHGIVDKALASLDAERQVTLSVPTFSQIPPLLEKTQLIFSLPKSFAAYLARFFPVKLIPLPFEVPAIDIYAYWHQRQHQNPLHQWVRKELLHAD